eukprot:gene44588-684_t
MCGAGLLRDAAEGEERVSEFQMKLIEIDSDSLGIPQQEYSASVQMPSAEFSRICKDIANFGDTVTIDVKKDGVSFAASGDIGTGRMLLKASRETDVAKQEKPAAAPPAQTSDTKRDDESTKPDTVPTNAVPDTVPMDAVPDTVPDAGTQPEGETKTEAPTEEGDGTPAAKRRRAAADNKEDKELAKALQKEEKALAKAEEKAKKDAAKAEEKVPQQVRNSVSDVVNVRLSKDDAGNDDEKSHRLGVLRYYLAPKVGEDGDDAAAGAAADDE